MGEKFDWVIKLDADAVFVQERLQKVLSTQPVSWSGTYVENCEGVQYGFFGSVEVLSHIAFETLVNKMDSCGVDKIQNFELTVDGVCPEVKKKWGGNPKS